MPEDHLTWGGRFVEQLERLRDTGDRGALAALRRGLVKTPATEPAMYPFVLPWLPEDVPISLERAAYLVAALFAWHPVPGGEGNLGTAFRRIPDQSGSIESRFVALLNCHPDDLSDHLRQAVGLLRAKDVPIDWGRLLRDIRSWDHPERFVQRAWAREYWKAREPLEKEQA